MRKFYYHGIHKLRVIISQIAGVIGILIFNSVAFLFLYALIKFPNNGMNTSLLNDPRITIFCLFVFFLLGPWLLGLTFINYLPTIWIVNEGLIISFLFIFRILIKWDGIVDVGKGQLPMGYTLVRTRKITSFHRIYGWMYSHSFYPSFIIGRGINDREILVNEIQTRMGNDVQE
jgi:hypothetical protein